MDARTNDAFSSRPDQGYGRVVMKTIVCYIADVVLVSFRRAHTNDAFSLTPEQGCDRVVMKTIVSYRLYVLNIC